MSINNNQAPQMEVQDVPVIVHVCVTVMSVIHFTSSRRGVNVNCKMSRPLYVFREYNIKCQAQASHALHFNPPPPYTHTQNNNKNIKLTLHFMLCILPHPQPIICKNDLAINLSPPSHQAGYILHMGSEVVSRVQDT